MVVSWLTVRGSRCNPPPQLAADPEISVKNGADLLDRLLKDIVAENSRPSTATATGPATAQPAYAVATDPLQTEVVGGFILPNFIPLLAERIYTVNPFTRSFLISWLSVLDALPDLELVSFLPDILDGLLGFVGDPNVDVRTGATTVLGEFLREIKEIANGMRGAATSLASSSTNVEDGAKSHRAIDVQYTKLIQILLPRTRAFANEETQAIALGRHVCVGCVCGCVVCKSAYSCASLPPLEWLGEFVTIASRRDIVDFVPELVASFLPCLANVTGSIRARAEEVWDLFGV